VEIHAQGFVLHRVPTNPYAEAQFAACEYIHLGGLLGNQGRLPLGENDDGRDQFQVRQGCQVAKEDKRFVEHLPEGVALPAWPVGRVCAQDVVKKDEVAVTESFYGLGIVAYDYGVCANFGLWKGDSYLHFRFPFCHSEAGKFGSSLGPASTRRTRAETGSIFRPHLITCGTFTREGLDRELLSGVEKSSTHITVSEHVDQTGDGKKQALVKRKQSSMLYKQCVQCRKGV
jgi:hypothetical protein